MQEGNLNMDYVVAGFAVFILIIGGLYWLNQAIKPKAAPPEPKPEVYDHWLYVYYKDGQKSQWYQTSPKNNGPVFPWRKFYKWYFATDKDDYVITVGNRSIVIPRDRINYFETIVKKAEK
jgi:hypothetical protein